MAKKQSRPEWQRFKDLLYLKMRPDDIELVMESYNDAKTGHGYEQQVRDSGERYFEHPKRVAVNLIHELEIYDADMIIAALLHDLVEDTFTFGAIEEAASRIQRRYNKRVATFVLALTKEPCDREEDKPERDRRYFERIANEGPKTMILKLADRLDNLRDLRRCSVEKKQHYVEETECYILPLTLEAVRQVTAEMAARITKVNIEMIKICERTRRCLAQR
ncbi:MAG: HD domain-containing protein [Candidatus Spechtbacterales bacterium]